MNNVLSSLINLCKHYQESLFNLKDPMADESLEPLFFSAQPQMIKYASSISNLSNYIEVPINTFEKHLNIRWTNSLLVRPHQRDAVWLDRKYPKTAWTIIEDRLHNPLNNLVICKINDTIGHGIFVAPDANPIPPGTIIGLYSGHLIDTIVEHPNPYVMKMNSEDENETSLNNLLKYIYVSALKTGNITRFLIDFPEKNELEQSQLASHIIPEIASQNLLLRSTTYYGAPTTVFYTARTIMPGEQLGYSYRGSFWAPLGNARCVFNKNYEVIGHFEEDKIILDPSFIPTGKNTSEDCRSESNSSGINSVEINTPETNTTSQDLNINNDLEGAEKLARSIINNTTYDSFDHEKRFNENVNFSLNLFMNRFTQYSKEGRFINRIQERFNAGNLTSEAKVHILEIELNNDKAKKLLISKKLLPLNVELTFHLNKYSEIKEKP
jgi:hypothetical protein